MKLNLGCGKKRFDGYINVDLYEGDETSDLSVFPWKWDDNSVDEVRMEHVLEHFREPEDVMREIHRILKPNGKATIIVPHISGNGACSIGHVSFFNYRFFDDFSRSRHHYFVERYKCPFEAESCKFQVWYFSSKYFSVKANHFTQQLLTMVWGIGAIEWTGIKKEV